MNKYFFLFALTILPVMNVSADIFKADRLFTERQYAEAKKGYLNAAKVGNPHAYYQLANMHYKGLGGEQDIINALLYFYLAAEQNFHNSEELIETILNSLDQDSRQNVVNVLEGYKLTHGKQQIINKYFPIINTDKLIIKATFDGEETLKTVYHPEDIELEDLNMDVNGAPSFDADGNEEFEEDSLALLISTPRVPFLIIDHDIHSDGSIRYTNEVQKFGFYKPLLDEFTLFPIAKPEFEGRPIDFVSRTYLGAAAYDKFTLVREYNRMYGQIIKQLQSFRKGESLNDKFNLAMLMLNFPWIDQEENEAEELLLALSKQGHSPAMYEYGLKLYREQRDIEQAIFWISEASKYGLGRAEYRLAKILQSSPWVNNDETKALFWYDSAMKKGDELAGIRVTDILINAKDESLRNMELAKQHLESLEATQSNNPEFIFLTALTHRYGENRDLKLTIETLRRAILKAQIANWDASDWQSILNDITSGTVYVEDQN